MRKKGKEDSLLAGFPPADSKRVDIFLQKLIPHLLEKRFLIVGGLAIRYQMFRHGIDYPIRVLNDLDLKVDSINVVLPSVSKNFMIYHYHPVKNDSFFIALVDPKTKIKVDIFDPTIKKEKFTEVPFHQWIVKVVGVEDQLVKTVFDIQRVSEEHKVDPKQFSDAKFLRGIANIVLADKIWRQRKYLIYPPSISMAIRRAEKIGKEHPEWVKEKPFRRPSPYVCPSCKSTKEFEITPMQNIYKELGYVE